MSAIGRIVAAIFSWLFKPVSRLDLERDLDIKAAASGEKLDWRNSVVDLMKCAGMDSSLEARKQKARQLGYTGELNGSAAMNIWLHRKIMEGLQH